MRNQFVGFGKASDFLAAVDRALPVNAECVTLNGKSGKFGIAIATVATVISQARSNETLYLYAPIARYRTINGEPMELESESDARRVRCEAAYEITLDWLAGAGVTARRALIATPTSYRLLEGVADYMRYDKNNEAWQSVTPAAGDQA